MFENFLDSNFFLRLCVFGKRVRRSYKSLKGGLADVFNRELRWSIGGDQRQMGFAFPNFFDCSFVGTRYEFELRKRIFFAQAHGEVNAVVPQQNFGSGNA